MLILILWLHLMAAVTWIGGMLFLSLVAVPILKPRTAHPGQADLFRAMAQRFRPIVWGAIGVLLVTGPLLVTFQGWALFEPGQWPSALRIKLGLVAFLLLLTGAHDLVIGPRVGALSRTPPESRTGLERMLVSSTPWLARGSLILALVILAMAGALS